jgi:hypothetical protein
VYHWNCEAITNNLAGCVGLICIIAFVLGVVYFIGWVATLLVSTLANRYPQYAYYYFVDETYSVNNTKHHIDENYEGCYVKENKEYCRKFHMDNGMMENETILGLMLFIVFDVMMPIMISLDNKCVLVGISCSIANILFFAVTITLIANIGISSAIRFYGNLPPNHFKEFVFSCKEKDDGYDIICEKPYIDILVACLACSAIALFVDFLIYATCYEIKRMCKEYNAYREKAKDQLRTGDAELV